MVAVFGAVFPAVFAFCAMVYSLSNGAAAGQSDRLNTNINKFTVISRPEFIFRNLFL